MTISGKAGLFSLQPGKENNHSFAYPIRSSIVLVVVLVLDFLWGIGQNPDARLPSFTRLLLSLALNQQRPKTENESDNENEHDQEEQK